MSRHDLSRLSPLDFEDLCRDILAAEWARPVESFRGGRDGGIDLRCASLDDGVIIQCKHFVRSGFAKLRSHLIHTERPKIERLKPARYIVATSVPMSPGNKAMIASDLAPYLLSPQDIIAGDDIAALLRTHPRVERTHYKLWLTSSAVLERVLHAAEHCQMEFAVDRIKHKLPLFVQTPTYIDAIRRLDEHRILVVSGPPGVGKTTLAEMALYDHMSRGYEPVVIQDDIAEGKKLYKKGERQIFYFDDFLGQTFYGDAAHASRANQDAALRDFIQAIVGSDTARFIMTTRDHILSAALQRSERLQHANLDARKHVLKVSDYSFANRAHILFNHLYFSELPQAHIDALIAVDLPVVIARHDDFNPRLIEWLSSRERMTHVEANAYPAHVHTLLHSPQILWEHAFQHEISFAAASVVLAVFSLGNNPFREDLEEAWQALHTLRARKYNETFAPNAFRLALKELEGSFLTFQDDRVAYLNPSLRDYVSRSIAASPDHARDIMQSAVRVQQVATLRSLAAETDASDLQRVINVEIPAFVARIDQWWDKPELQWRGRYGHYVDLAPLTRLELLIEFAEQYQNDGLAQQAKDRVTPILEKSYRGNDTGVVARLIESTTSRKWFMANHGAPLIASLKTFVFAALNDRLATSLLPISRSLTRAPSAWTEAEHSRIRAAQADYQSDGALNEIGDTTDVDDMETLQIQLKMLSDEAGLDLSYEMNELESKIEENAKPEKPEEESDYEYDGDDDAAQEIQSDDDVRDLFSCLGS